MYIPGLFRTGSRPSKTVIWLAPYVVVIVSSDEAFFLVDGDFFVSVFVTISSSWTDTADNGKIVVNEFYETNIPGYYAIGDIIPGPALAHVASAEGITCVEKIVGENPDVIDYGNIPGCTYCSPEVASVGMTEAAAKEAGFELKIGKFPFSASGKASAAGMNDGFIKLIFDAKYGELLGAHMIGGNVTEMIAEIVAIRKLETTGHELIKTIHPHPTMSEAIMEAAAAAYGEVIHM